MKQESIDKQHWNDTILIWVIPDDKHAQWELSSWLFLCQGEDRTTVQLHNCERSWKFNKDDT